MRGAGEDLRPLLLGIGVGAALAVAALRLRERGHRQETGNSPAATVRAPSPSPVVNSEVSANAGRMKKRAISFSGGEQRQRSASASDANSAAVPPVASRSAPNGAQTLDSKLDDNSDSDEDNAEAKVPRELLSPVPRNQLTTIVVFGADGNLAEKKLLPMLYWLWVRRLLPRDVLIFGFARPKGAGGRLGDTGEFRFFVLQLLREFQECQRDDSHPAEFVARCHFVTGQFGDIAVTRVLLASMREEELRRFKTRAHATKWMRHTLSGRGSDAAPPAVRMWYMSVPPFLYARICAALSEARAERAQGEDGGGSRSPPHPEDRFVLEKPFGRDHASCAALMAELSMLKREETFYIDHYLGKELVMNLLVLRFANVCFGGVWNRSYIKSVQVIFKEKVGTQGVLAISTSMASSAT